MATLLLIDDEEQIRTHFEPLLEQAGYRVLSAGGSTQALHLAKQHSPDLALVDLFMPGMDGLELIQALRTAHPGCKIIAMTGGSGEWNYLDAATLLGARATLKKPFSLQELLDTIASTLEPDRSRA
ncbi:MAG: response regulator [Nitrospira sp.]